MATAAERKAIAKRNLAKARAAKAAKTPGEPTARAASRSGRLPPASMDARDRQFTTTAPNPKAVVASVVFATYAFVMYAYGADGVFPGEGGDGDTPDAGDDDESEGGGGDAPDPADCNAARSAALDKLNAAFNTIETRQTLATGVGCTALAAWEGANLELNSAAANALLNSGNNLNDAQGGDAADATVCQAAATATAEHASWLATGVWPGNNLPKPACAPGEGEGEQGDGEDDNGNGDDDEGGNGEGEGEGEGDDGEGDEDEGAPPCFSSDSISNTQYEAVLNYITGLMSTRSEVPAMVAAGFSVAQWAAVDPEAVGYYYMDGAMLRLAQLRGDNAARDRIVNAIVTGGENPCVFGQNLQGLRIEIGEDFQALYPNPGNFTWPA